MSEILTLQCLAEWVQESFKFKIQDKVTKQYHKIEVENSQIEIDMAIEGAKSLSLIEAKLFTFSNFN